MKELIAVIFAIVVSVGSQPYGAEQPDPKQERERLTGIATDIAKVSLAQPVFDGPKGAEATAIALLTVAQMESGFWAKVQDCSICYPGSQWCDQGRSITLYQLQGRMAWGQYSREQLCESNTLATERAHAILHRFRNVRSTLALFDAYGRGGPVVMAPARAAQKKNNAFNSHLRKRGIRIVWRNGGLWAE